MKKRTLKIVLIVLAVILLIAIWIVLTNVNIKTTSVTVENRKVPQAFDGFKIAQVSDLHNRQWGDKLLKPLIKQKPDIIVLTGDLVDTTESDYEETFKFVRKAAEIAPVYYVTGNHEVWLENMDEFKARLESCGVHIMDNSRLWLKRGNDRINLAGLQDPAFASNYIDGNFAGEGASDKLDTLLKSGNYNVVLCHRPELFAEYVHKHAELILTGHAHGGQVRIPFAGGVVAPDQGFFPKYTKGLYHSGDTDMVVSRGLGNSVISVRINNMPELVIVTLKRK